MPLILQTSLETFEFLHRLADGRKATIRMERDILIKLLVDHSALCRTCKDHGIKIAEPVPPRRTRVKLKV